MKLKYLTMLLVLALFLIQPGFSSVRASVADTPVTASGTSPDSQLVQKKEPITLSKQQEENSFYRIEIKENRTASNNGSQRILSGFNNRNLRAKLISFREYLPKDLKESYMMVVDHAFRFPVIFYILTFIILFALNVFIVIGILFITNRIMNLRKSIRIKIRARYEIILTDLLLQVIDTRQAVQQLTNPKQKKNYNLLIDVMMDFQKSFRGEADRQIIELYQTMDLGRLSYNKTFAISSYEQVKGIRELTNMHPIHATEMIIPRLNDPNDIVRSEAQICYPYVNKEDPFGFLGFLEKPFSQWAQLNIYYYIKIHELPVPSFDRWINSSHINVVNFCLLMMDLFQQHENSAVVIRQLRHRDEATRKLAINACGNLQLFESKPELKDIFKEETTKNKVAILKAFSTLGDETDLQFLEEILRIGVIPIRLEACRTLYHMSESGRVHLEEVNHSMDFELTPFIDHIKDPRN